MKKVILFAALFVLLIVSVSRVQELKVKSLENLFTYSVCDTPIKYRIDTIDSEFGLSRDEFLLAANKGAQIWNNNINKDLLVHDQSGDLSVNLIFDERQSLNNRINDLEDTVNIDQQSLNPKISEYEKLSAEFKQKIESLNKKIEDWNNKGGAPSDEYQKIVEEQKLLQQEANKLNGMAQSLNISTREYNSQVNNLNQTIREFREVLVERPEEGVFKGPENRIEIYFYVNNNELIHTLAHEFGHALGLDHNENSKAIMYSKTNQNIILSQEDEDALNELCKRHNIFELLQIYLSKISIKNIKFSI